MFDKNNDQRLQAWSEFRKSLETSNTPIQDVLDFYSQSPIVSIHTDPWDQKIWPQPWELILENQYCSFCTVLGMCYSLQLTDRFKQVPVEIHICIDREDNETYYLLLIEDRIIGYEPDTHIAKSDLPETIISQREYHMSGLQ